MDIAVCGEAQVRLLVGSGLVLDVADLYRLRLAEVAGVEEKGSGFARELMEGLAASKTRELWRLIFGLGIPGVDRGTAQALAGAWPALDDLLGAGRDQLVQVGGVSSRAADNLVQWHGDPRNRRIVKQLRKAGLNFGV
jgi:DNA ligase (NAD+)